MVFSSKNLKWFVIPFSYGADFFRNLHHDPIKLGVHGMAYNFIELDKAAVHVIRLLVFCDYGFQSVCPLMEKDKRLMEASCWERLTEGLRGKVGLILMGGVMLGNSLIQFSVDEWGCVPSL